MASTNQVQSKPPIRWSDIPETDLNIEKLKLLTHTVKALKREGYTTEPLTEHEIWAKMRCRNCGTKVKNYRPSSQVPQSVRDEHYNDDVPLGFERNGQGMKELTAQQQYTLEVERARATMHSNQRVKHICFFHDGRLFKGEYDCCGGRQNTQGCCSEIAHAPGDLKELRKEWQFYASPEHKITPSLPLAQATSSANIRGGDGGLKRGSEARGRIRGRGGRFQNKKQPPIPTSPAAILPKRRAVSLDCEMGLTTLSMSTLIRLTVVDLFTREILIDSLVAPAPPHRILHYNTRYSGVTFSAMNHAIRTGNVIHGSDAARKLLFKHIDSETIVVVHGGDNDFTTLRWIHPVNRIIDTHILEGWDPVHKEMKLKKSLKEVVWRRCGGIEIQNAKLMNGRQAGHDSVEDALACREFVAAWLTMIPDD